MTQYLTRPQRHQVLLLAVLLGGLLLLAGELNGQNAGGIVQVSLRPLANPTAGCVRLGDLADVSGGTPDLCRRIAQLDVADVVSQEKGAYVTRDQVAFRLQLAGLKSTSFQVSGTARSYVVSTSPRLTAESLAEEARQAVRQRLPAIAEEVSIKLAQPVHVPSIDLKPGETIRLIPEIAGAELAGKARVSIGVFVQAQRRATVPVVMEVGFLVPAAVTRRRLIAGEVLKEDALLTRATPVEGAQVPLTLAECVGKRLKKSLLPGQRVTEADVESGEAAEPVLIQQREIIRLVAQIGSVQVTAQGEALQEGRLGQIIRARNIDSGKVVSGKVIERGVVAIAF